MVQTIQVIQLLQVVQKMKIMEGGLDYGKRKCDNHCQLGSAGA